MKKVFYFISLFVVLYSCKEKNSGVQVVDTDDFVQIDVDWSKINFVDIDISYFIDSISYVKLETNDSCLISRISKISYFDGYYYIFDGKSSAVLKFDKDGRFIYKIRNIGQGPGEYFRLSTFAINQKDGTIDLLDGGKRTILKYNLETGLFEKSMRLDYNCLMANFQCTPSGTYIGYTPEKKHQAFGAIFEIDKDGHIKTLLEEESEYPIVLALNDVALVYKYGNNDFCNVFSKTEQAIYRVQNDTIKRAYQYRYTNVKTALDYPNKSIDDIGTDAYDQLLECFYMKESENWIYKQYAYYNQSCASLFSKKENKLIFPKNITHKEGIIGNRVTMEGIDALAFLLPPAGYEKIEYEINPQLKELVKTGHEDDNPIVQIMYFR